MKSWLLRSLSERQAHWGIDAPRPWLAGLYKRLGFNVLAHQGSQEASQFAGQIACSAVIDWSDGRQYGCERDDPHDGEVMMHGADIGNEWTNWSDSYTNCEAAKASGGLPNNNSPALGEPPIRRGMQPIAGDAWEPINWPPLDDLKDED